MLISPGHPRAYASGGLGPMKTRVEGVAGFFDVDSSDFGLNLGGDIRYFRTLTDPEPHGEFDVDLGSLDYWRHRGRHLQVLTWPATVGRRGRE
jgi:hypothetical protein